MVSAIPSDLFSVVSHLNRCNNLSCYCASLAYTRKKSAEARRLSLQKQFGCFNLRVVTMVADKLKRQWL